MLHVIYDDYVLCQDPGDALPHQQYVCKVSYCGRQHFVRRRFSEFKLLHDKLQKELLVVPGFPSADVSYKVGLGDYAARGKALCRYACRVHASLGARGMFSPRLLAFLEIDAARVHIEEDGRVRSRRPVVESHAINSCPSHDAVGSTGDAPRRSARCSTPRPRSRGASGTWSTSSG